MSVPDPLTGSTPSAAPYAGMPVRQPEHETISAASLEPGEANSPGPEPLLQLPRAFGRYELRRLLGRGGMGAVFLAYDSQLDRLVALKLPEFRGIERDTLKERFLREARAAAKLSHPNLCPVFDVGQVGELPYLTMSFIDGKSLAEIVRGGQLPPAAQVARWVRDIALAIHEAHRHGIIHRDLKPSNVIINQRGEPIVTDFGLAYQAAPTGDARLTRSGAIVGTPAYMAPEQIGTEGSRIGPACDIYSLGVVLYEALAGRPPFQAAALGELLAQISRDAPPPPSRFRPGLDPALEAVCLKALGKRPADRFASMTAFAEALAPWTRETSPPTQSRTIVDQPASVKRTTNGAWANLVSTLIQRLSPVAHRVRRWSNAEDAGKSSADDFGTVAYEKFLQRRRVRRRAYLAMSAVAALLLGLLLYPAFRPKNRDSFVRSEIRNPLVTRENYVKIKPDMLAWEVNDLLGPGVITSEEGLIVDAAGNFKKWTKDGGAYESQAGTIAGHDGKPVMKIKRVAVWRSDQKAITVTFFNDKVIAKSERGLIDN